MKHLTEADISRRIGYMDFAMKFLLYFIAVPGFIGLIILSTTKDMPADVKQTIMAIEAVVVCVSWIIVHGWLSPTIGRYKSELANRGDEIYSNWHRGGRRD